MTKICDFQLISATIVCSREYVRESVASIYLFRNGHNIVQFLETRKKSWYLQLLVKIKWSNIFLISNRPLVFSFLLDLCCHIKSSAYIKLCNIYDICVLLNVQVYVIGGEGILEELQLAGITAFGGPVSSAYL